MTVGPTTHLRPQTWYIDIPLSQFDFIGRVETLRDDIDKLRKFFSFKGNPAINKGTHKTRNKQDYRSYYTGELLKKINTVYAKDFEILPYDMQPLLPWLK